MLRRADHDVETTDWRAKALPDPYQSIILRDYLFRGGTSGPGVRVRYP